jgi:sensitive to high expression protein 9
MPPPPTEHESAKPDEKPAASSPEEHLSASSEIQEAAFAMPPPSDAEPTKQPSGEQEDNAESTKPPNEELIAEEKITRVAAEDLPSHREGQRWDFSKRMSEFMDEVLPKLAVVTQKVNTYTGTDYSSIAALKQEIKDQGTASRKFLKSTPV